MLQEIEVLEIKLMYKQGKKLKQIAKETGCSINTVRKYARDNSRANYYSSRPSKESKLIQIIIFPPPKLMDTDLLEYMNKEVLQR